MDFHCFKCEHFCSSINEIIGHLRKEHCLIDNDEPFKCAVNSSTFCGKKFLTFSGLRNHMKSCSQRNGNVRFCIVENNIMYFHVVFH